MIRNRPHHLRPSIETVRVALVYRDVSGEGVSHVGLGICAAHTAKTLRQHGIWAEVWPSRDAKQIVERLRQVDARAGERGEDPRAHTAVIGTDSPTLLPGTLFLGRRVSMVEHQVLPESVRTLIWFEGTNGNSGEGDRLTRAVGAIVRHLTAHIDYFALYPSKLVSQNDDGTLELKPDDSRLPGLSKVPIRYGIPGVTVKVASGARVLVGFEGGDPGAPVATLWELGSVTEMTIDASTDIKVNGGTQAVARQGDSVHAGFLKGALNNGDVELTYTPYDPNIPPPMGATPLSGGQITSGAGRFHA